MAESSTKRYKTLGEKEKLFVTSNFSFFHNILKRLVLQTRKKPGLVWERAKYQVWKFPNKLISRYTYLICISVNVKSLLEVIFRWFFSACTKNPIDLHASKIPARIFVHSKCSHQTCPHVYRRPGPLSGSTLGHQECEIDFYRLPSHGIFYYYNCIRRYSHMYDCIR